MRGISGGAILELKTWLLLFFGPSYDENWAFIRKLFRLTVTRTQHADFVAGRAPLPNKKSLK